MDPKDGAATTSTANLNKSISTNWGVYGALIESYRSRYRQFLTEEYSSLCQTISPQWPRRLLHVPTMTSVERSDGNMYGQDKEPEYNALSYKWGLFVVDDGPRLEVKGINWRIPAVDQTRFSVKELERVLQNMAKEIDYVWLDVACVDQGIPSATISEVQREPGIFRNAKQAFVWLNGYTTDELQTMLEHISSYSLFTSTDTISVTASHLRALFRNPWFKSVWTLREILARRDALILDQDGNTLTKWGHRVQLNNIVESCCMFLALLQQGRDIVDDFHDPALHPPRSGRADDVAQGSALITEMRSIVEDSGAFFLFCGDPHELLAETGPLLETAEMISRGSSQMEHRYTSHAQLTALCRCDTQRKCTPCILNISYKQGPITVSRYDLTVWK
jgi:hypothetical protein